MEDDSVVKHMGGCHCGKVRFTAIAPQNVIVYICNCSICIKKQIKGFIVPDDHFEIMKGNDNLSEYSFNTGTAKHWFCKSCGVQSFYKPRSNPEGISVMVNCLDSGTLKKIKEVIFDGQNWEEAIKNVHVTYS